MWGSPRIRPRPIVIYSIGAYTTPLSYVIQRHNVKHHFYADDTQIYLSLSLKKSRYFFGNSHKMSSGRVFLNVIKKISKLQGVQNCLARVVTKSPRFCHIIPLLKSLHWLPVRYRIKFKLCSLTYQAVTSIYSKHVSAIAKGTDTSLQ